MVKIDTVDANGTQVQGLLVEQMGGAGHPNLILIQCKKGYLMCGYLNLPAAEKFGDAAVLVGGADFAAVLSNPIKDATSPARALGVKDGMTGAEAAAILNA